MHWSRLRLGPPLRSYLLVMTFSLMVILGGTGAAALNTDSGRVKVSLVTVPDGTLQLSAMLYRPADLASGDRRAGVVLAHGISESKEILSGIALELAKQGIVALTIDLVGILGHYQRTYAGAMYSGCGGGYLYVVSDEQVPGSFTVRVRCACGGA